jgi:hypothetical protein
MLKRLAFVALTVAALALCVTGCDSGSKDSTTDHSNMPGMKK